MFRKWKSDRESSCSDVRYSTVQYSRGGMSRTLLDEIGNIFYYRVSDRFHFNCT